MITPSKSNAHAVTGQGATFSFDYEIDLDEPNITGGQTHTVSEPIEIARRDPGKVSHYLRKLVSAFRDAIHDEPNDYLARYEAMSEAKIYFGLAFKHRKTLSENARRFLGRILVILNNKVLIEDVIALKCFNRIVAEYAQFIAGCTEKDIDNWCEQLRDAGFSFSQALDRVVPGTTLDNENEDEQAQHCENTESVEYPK